MDVQPFENTALSWGTILRPACVLAEITIRKSQVDDFLGIAETEAMADLLDPLPKDKRGPIIDQMFGLVSGHRDNKGANLIKMRRGTRFKSIRISRTTL
jgi:hypothetical protein